MKLGRERAAAAHQQRRRPVSADAAGAGSTAYPGTVRHRLRSQTVGIEAGGTRRKKRKEASHRGHGEKTGGVIASFVGERRGVRALAQQQRNDSGGSGIKSNGKTKRQKQNRSRKRKNK